MSVMDVDEPEWEYPPPRKLRIVVEIEPTREDYGDDVDDPLAVAEKLFTWLKAGPILSAEWVDDSVPTPNPNKPQFLGFVSDGELGALGEEPQ